MINRDSTFDRTVCLIESTEYLEDTLNDLTQGVFSQRKQMLSLLDIITN